MTNQYHKVAMFLHEAGVEELRQFFLDVLKINPETALQVLNYGDVTWMEEVMAELRDHKKICAIKIYRQHTDADISLKDAKDAVEAIIVEHFPMW